VAVTAFLAVLAAALVASLPVWPYSRGWGYYPSGSIGLLLIIALALFSVRGVHV
jgi:hypothetical protein